MYGTVMLFRHDPSPDLNKRDNKYGQEGSGTALQTLSYSQTFGKV